MILHAPRIDVGIGQDAAVGSDERDAGVDRAPDRLDQVVGDSATGKVHFGAQAFVEHARQLHQVGFGLDPVDAALALLHEAADQQQTEHDDQAVGGVQLPQQVAAEHAASEPRS